ncbi:hypothetical protein F5984_11490 [Rudanella paleaurantiibacter]|uniref:Uncharacterized protein n=1 Tax=Rudanella paleaurantiibacter TaxID=2614655 RepID=A0A7J5U1A7_9BACT|nr:hypothetical protein [Rudanella paleaurantiibacter]KAB7731407.1 hypothetical protein F5984_11490 [Rudanella paleaurantiibacter]
MVETFTYWFVRYGSALLIISTLVLLLRWRTLSPGLRWISLFIATATLGEIISKVTSRYLHINNLALFHGYTFIEFNAIALFYRQVFGSFVPRWLIPAVMVFFSGFALINTLYIQAVTGIHTYTLVLECLLVIGMALLAYYQMLAELRTTRLETSPVFWINTGFLLYFAGVLFLFMLRNVFIKSAGSSFELLSNYLHLGVIILLHLFISIGLWLSPKSRLISY